MHHSCTSLTKAPALTSVPTYQGQGGMEQSEGRLLKQILVNFQFIAD